MLDEQDKAYAATVARNKKFRAWLVEDSTSRALLVNGYNDEVSDFESPFSFLCAQVITMFEHTDSALVVSFFCRCHTGYDDSLIAPGATGLISSLAGQLISQMQSKGVSPDLSFLDDEDCHRIKRGDIDTLCFLFRKLVLQLPREKILICALDEISLYESPDKRAETDRVMNELSRLLRREPNAVVKLLVTCLGQSLEAHQYFDERDIIHVEERPERDTSGSWNLGSAQGDAYDFDQYLTE
ncbi:hypothetical protein PVAG01_07377 [Phlyctema vagabunda]|uniref:Nephrocystin 3-like N-terminal domain-containing protein n=1 Tax=Phlyctema vagabunda TaxID=108571 RepID=A0ABR4PC93_9HELO